MKEQHLKIIWADDGEYAGLYCMDFEPNGGNSAPNGDPQLDTIVYLAPWFETDTSTEEPRYFL